jgi:predicted regulator of Ras-like GTPase activity (Roadblock/LC7/MglB family)
MPTLQEFKNLADDLTGINRLVVVARDGTVLLHSGNQQDRLGDYVAYIAVTAEQLKPHLAFTGPYHLIMEQTSGDRILTLLGQLIIVGVDLDAHVPPAMILDQLAPLVDQITF